MTDAATDSPHESTRDRLLHAARTAFADKGFHGTTTRDIAAAAGLSPAGVYVHHRSKEAMLFEISLAGHTALADEVEGARASYDQAGEQLAQIVRIMVETHARENDMARVVNYELSALTPEHRALVDVQRRRIQDTLAAVIEVGALTGEFVADDPAMTATAISGMAIDVARWYRPERSWQPQDVAAQHAAMALRMVGATTPAE